MRQLTPHCEKKPFCFSFPPENSRIKDRKSRCRYQNNLPAAHRVFLNYPCQKSYSRKILARNNRYGRKIPAFWCQKRWGQKIPESNYRYGRNIWLPVTADTAGKSRHLIRPENSAASNCSYGRKIPASNYQIRLKNSAASNYRPENPKKEYNECHRNINTGRQWRRKILVAQKTQQKIQAHMPKTFFALCTKWVSGTRSG